MATLYIEEWKGIMIQNGHAVPIPIGLLGTKKLTIASASNATSAATSVNANFVYLTSDTACQYTFGASPTATGTSRFIPANGGIFTPITGGHKIAVTSQK